MTLAAKAAVQTPQARLASVIKTSRDIMRKDAGLNGDLDRLPQLSWCSSSRPSTTWSRTG